MRHPTRVRALACTGARCRLTARTKIRIQARTAATHEGRATPHDSQLLNAANSCVAEGMSSIKRRKGYARRACVSCCVAKRGCDDRRPCDRCMRLGKVCEDKPSENTDDVEVAGELDGICPESPLGKLVGAHVAHERQMAIRRVRPRWDVDLAPPTIVTTPSTYLAGSSRATTDSSGISINPSKRPGFGGLAGYPAALRPSTDPHDDDDGQYSADVETRAHYHGSNVPSGAFSHGCAAAVPDSPVFHGDSAPTANLRESSRMDSNDRLARAARDVFARAGNDAYAAKCCWAIGALRVHAELTLAAAMLQKELALRAVEMGGVRELSQDLLQACIAVDTATAEAWAQTLAAEKVLRTCVQQVGLHNQPVPSPAHVAADPEAPLSRSEDIAASAEVAILM